MTCDLMLTKVKKRLYYCERKFRDTELSMKAVGFKVNRKYL